MSALTASPSELIPVGTRLSWMLLCRVVLTAIVPAGLLIDGVNHRDLWTVLTLAVPWLLITVPTLLLPRMGRSVAVAAFNISLLGDGLLLCALWRVLGGLDGPGGHLVWVHCAAVTLLASFRTGVKLAVWQGLLALVSLEATATGVWGEAAPFSMAELAVYQVTLLSSVMATAGFAAVNERELRRRRFDSDVLRRLAFDLASERPVDEMMALLAGFATNELLATRALVVAYQRQPDTGTEGDGVAVLVQRDGTVSRPAAPGELPMRSVVVRAIRRSRTQLLARLSSDRDPWLTEHLPAARDLIVVPFTLEQITGALVMESPRSRIGRVELRVQDTAEQATALAAMALGRAVLNERVRSAADTDGLTGLANRRMFDHRLAGELDRARANGEHVGLLMVDLDHFKQLNDRYGHQTGDEVLRQAAQVLAAHATDGNVAARYGGEEFAVILVGAAARVPAATAIAEEIRQALWKADTVVPVTASIGVAVSTAQTESVQALITAADGALYEAKAHGRDRVEVAHSQPALAA